MLGEINRRFGGRSAASEADRKPVGELVPLTDEEYESARTTVAAQIAPIRDAYMRGMAKAETSEERGVLAQLRRLIGPPRDG